MQIQYSISSDIQDLENNDILNIRVQKETINNKNLFNENDRENNFITAKNGVLHPSDDDTSIYRLSYIKVLPGETYTAIGFKAYGINVGVAYVGYNKDFIGCPSLLYFDLTTKESLSTYNSTDNYLIQFTIPENNNIEYVAYNSVTNYTYTMFIHGDISQWPDEYVKYTPETYSILDHINADNMVINNYETKINNICKSINDINQQASNYLNVEHIISENLFNPNGDFLNGYYSSDGNFVENNGLIHTQLIKITKAGTYYMILIPKRFGSQYNKDGAGYFFNNTGALIASNRNNLIIDGNAKDEDDKWVKSVVAHFILDESYIGLYFAYPVATELISETMLIFGNSYPEEYIEYQDYYKNDKLKIQATNIIGLPNIYDDSKYEKNHLYGKTIVFDGDSICCATGDEYEGLTGKLGWAARIGHKNGMNWYNYAVGGGTLVTGLYNSSGSARHWVSDYIDTIHNNHPNLDYYIFEGGTNDADLLGIDATGEKYGTLNLADYTSGLWDTTKFRNAIDMICYKATKYWPHAKIGYIVAQKMGRSNSDYTAANSRRRLYFEMAIEMCKKWGIPYIDLWDGSPLNPSIITHYDSSLDATGNREAGKLYYDGQHLTKEGYNFISPMIEAFIKSL